MQESNKEQEERIHLIREYRLSELILQKKKDELESEKNKNRQLNNLLNKQNEINIRLKEEIKNLTLFNKRIENENKIKRENLQILLKKYNEGKSFPVQKNNNEVNDNDNDNIYTFNEI